MQKSIFSRFFLTGSLIVASLLYDLNNIKAQDQHFNLANACNSLAAIKGKASDTGYLYTTAGNRLYCIGSQDGKFPEIGFHVPGEMGGIWQQPIKLLDGFSFNIREAHSPTDCLIVCDSFINYSFASKFYYAVSQEDIKVIQTQFVPDNLPVMIVEYKIQNLSLKRKQFDFCLHTAINLMPVWLAERINITDGPDRLLSEDGDNHLIIFKDEYNPWYAGISFENDNARLKEINKTRYKGKGIAALTNRSVDLAAGATEYFRFYVAGSTKTSQDLTATINLAKSQLARLFNEKKNRIQKLAQTASIQVPDSLLQTAYEWGKYTTDWLQRDVPGLGKGLSAGLPDYPWYFSNDQAATFMALTGTIEPQLFYDAFKLLKSVSDRANDSSGRIIHEVSDNGVVYNKGNMQESQLHIIAAWQIFKWTGNIAFLKENYAFAKRTWHWLEQHDLNHNGYIEGYGGTEIEGLNDEMLDVQVNTFLFLNVLSQMATIFNEPDLATQLEADAIHLKNNINKDWWVETENCYADFICQKEKALQLIDNALTKRVNPDRNKWAQIKLNDLKKSILENSYHSNGYLVYYNASILDPVSEGMTDTARAKEMITRVGYFTNKFGTYITGIERPDDVSIDEKPFQKDTSFTYNKAVMPAGTAGLIKAAARYGMPDTALKYMHLMLNTFSYATPGTTYEVSPDYGMFVQAWNISCLNIPLIQYFFGVDPMASKKEISLHLQMPAKWEKASLNNLIIGSSLLSIDYKKEKNKVTCTIRSTEPGWKIHFIIPSDSKILDKKLTLRNNHSIELTGKENIIQYNLL